MTSHPLSGYFIFAIFILVILFNIIKTAIRRKTFVNYGIEIEGSVTGVARPKTIINTSKINDIDNAFFGDERLNVRGWSGRRSVEQSGDARVKIIYTDPVTQEHQTIRTVLDKNSYHDYRIYKISNPTLIRISKAKLTALKYNRKLFSSYKQEVLSRNISSGEKKQLLLKAKQAKVSHYSKPPQDSEGYSILTPPVPIELYYLNGDFLFKQKTNIPVLEDWTKELD